MGQINSKPVAEGNAGFALKSMNPPQVPFAGDGAQEDKNKGFFAFFQQLCGGRRKSIIKKNRNGTMVIHAPLDGGYPVLAPFPHGFGDGNNYFSVAELLAGAEDSGFADGVTYESEIEDESQFTINEFLENTETAEDAVSLAESSDSISWSIDTLAPPIPPRNPARVVLAGQLCAITHDRYYRRHTSPSSLQPPATSNQQPATFSFPPSRITTQDPMAPTRPCIFFQQGRCRAGDGCTYSHTAAPTSTIPPATPTPTPIRQRPAGAVVSQAAHLAHLALREGGVGRAGTDLRTVGATAGAEGAWRSHRTTTAAPGPGPGLLVPCRFFQMGHCGRGEGCKFAHVTASTGLGDAVGTAELGAFTVGAIQSFDQPTPTPTPAAATAAAPRETDVRVMGTTLSVTFGGGLTIASIGSASDTNIVTMQHLPARADVRVIQELLSRFKFDLPLEAIRATPIDEGTYATAKFADSAQAAAAIAALDGLVYEDHTLAVKLYRLKGLAGVSQSATRVSCTFFAPARIASITFNSQRLAVQAMRRCDGKRIRGRKMEFKDHRNYRLFSSKGEISVGGLAAATTKDELKVAFNHGVKSIFLHDPTYDLSAHEAMAHIASLFTQRAPDVEGWEIVSPADMRKTKTIIRFKSAAAALDAVRNHDGKVCAFLGGSQIFLQPIYTANFKIVPEIHRAVVKELECLMKDQPPGVQIRVFGGETQSLATVRVTGQDKKKVSAAKTMVGKIVRGRLFQTATGEAIWDPFWATAEGIQKITGIGRETATFVFCDKRKSQLFLFGTVENQEKAVERLHGCKAAIAESGHKIALEGGAWRSIMRGGLRALQERFGANMVKIDVTKRCIMFTGSAVELEETRTLLKTNTGAEKDVTSTATADGDCPICFDTAESPIQFSSCGHTYCLSCLRDYARSTLDTRKFPIACIGATCERTLDLAVLATILTPAEYETILSTAFTDHIRSHPTEYSYCPTPNCPTVYRTTTSTSSDTVLTCASCLLDICTSCAVEAHTGLTCSAYKLSIHSDTDADVAFEQWKRRNRVHACPACGTDIQKSDGCDHITCAVCKAHICWKCLMVFARSPEVYTHMTKEHGGIGVQYDGDSDD
ncbi:hypothetical protein BZA05DRAFT_447937 [Tricharina praecox]|uniref:uncharacterized protein n=1 Tax=Tricharina praecox TaxID=43433 RepID=UPI00221F946D|nr:uncharacterized protein BZA05DRAFT_447937 [Tricharina praecox]KAI5845346.1 hypothetical protein BZA05DRAFT_447937 [Tricharina praecox]